MFLNESHELLSLEHSFPYPISDTPLDQLWNNVNQVLSWRVALYISPCTGYNKLLLALYLPEPPEYLSYDGLLVNPGRNILLTEQETMHGITHQSPFQGEVCSNYALI